MKIVFLGTGGGFPSKTRGVASIAVRVSGEHAALPTAAPASQRGDRALKAFPAHSARRTVELLALEECCSTRGDLACEFVAREPAAWRKRGDPRAERLLASLDLARLRDLVAAELETERRETPAEGEFDPNSPVVHIWGQVMILPFSGADASIEAVELIGKEAGAAGVSVVVVDLGGVILDEGFGAVALERVIDSIQSFGAEPILTGVSPLCAPLVASLECGQVLVEKDLSQAIATAFQIAHAQRRGV